MLPINVLILLVATAGWVLLVIAAVNRFHSIPIRGYRLRMVRVAHDILLHLFVLGIPIGLGFFGPRLVYVESWHEIPIYAMLILSVGWFSSWMFLGRTIFRWIKTDPQHVIRSTTEKIVPTKDELREWTGPGKNRLIVRLPGNECFQIEKRELELGLNRLPAAWSGLRLAHFSDTHFNHTVSQGFYVRACEILQSWQPDLIVFSGDLLDDQRLTSWIGNTFGLLEAPLGKYFVLGNHDWYHEPDHTRQVLQGFGWVDVSSRVKSLSHRGAKCWIAGTEAPWMGSQPVFPRESSGEFRILVSHSPDQLPWARQNQVDLMLAGHLHGGQVRLPILGPLYSPSWHGCRYDSGIFLESPTTLYVNRGLGGKQPIRFRCPPELTLLTLHSASLLRTNKQPHRTVPVG